MAAEESVHLMETLQIILRYIFCVLVRNLWNTSINVLNYQIHIKIKPKKADMMKAN